MTYRTFEKGMYAETQVRGHYDLMHKLWLTNEKDNHGIINNFKSLKRPTIDVNTHGGHGNRLIWVLTYTHALYETPTATSLMLC